MFAKDIFCQRCGGVLYEDGEEVYCLCCGASHDLEGNLIRRDPVAEGINTQNYGGKHNKRLIKVGRY